MLTKQELIETAYEITGGNVADLAGERLRRLLTVTQFVTDICLNEIERRGELETRDGVPIVPYESAFIVETILTRPDAIENAHPRSEPE
jgi:hypothetical protein